MYTNISKINYMNTSDDGYVLCYNTKHNIIAAVNLDIKRNREVIEHSSNWFKLPFQKQIKGYVWKLFYKSLSPEENEIANSFDERHGFFDYMKITGLYGAYEVAEEKAVDIIFKNWEEENNVTIDWSTVVLPF